MDQCVFIIAHHPGPVGSTSEELSVSLLFFFHSPRRVSVHQFD